MAGLRAQRGVGYFSSDGRKAQMVGQHWSANGFIHAGIVTCERLIRKRDGKIRLRWRLLR